MRFRFLLRVGLIYVAFVWLVVVALPGVGHAQYLYWAGQPSLPGATQPNVLRSRYDDASVEGVFRAAGAIQGIAIDGDDLFLASRASGNSTILRSGLDGSGVLPLFSTSSSILSLDFDRRTERLYFHDSALQRFSSLNSDGTDVQGFVMTGSSDSVLSIAVDGDNRMIYWTQLDSLWRASLDGGAKELLAGPNSALGLKVHSVALDAARGEIYWTEWHPSDSPFLFGGRIRRANLDGTDQHTVITGLPREDDLEGHHSTLFNSTYLVIDPLANLLFTFNESLGDISRANLDGSQLQETFIRNQGVEFLRGMDVMSVVPEPSTNVLVCSAGAAMFWWLVALGRRRLSLSRR